MIAHRRTHGLFMLVAIGVFSLLQIARADPPAATQPAARIDAVHVHVQVDDGNGTAVKEEWDYWAARAVGHRTEMNSHVSMYSAADRRSYEGPTKDGPFTSQRANDGTLIIEYLRRGDVRYNPDFCIDERLRAKGNVREEVIEVNGRTIRRLTTELPRHKTVVVDIDPKLERVIRAERWIEPQNEQKPFRVVEIFDYPDPKTLGPDFFKPPATAPIIAADFLAGASARTECITQLRGLAGLLAQYAAAHDGKLPAALTDLRGMEGMEESMLLCPGGQPLDYPAAGRLLDDTKPTDTLVEGNNHPGYPHPAVADGHADVLSDK